MRNLNEGQFPEVDETLPLETGILMDAFNFSGTDLAANKQGYVTGHQKAQLGAELKQEADGMWLILTIMLGVTVLLSLIMTSEGIPLIYLVIGAGLLLLPLVWLAYRRQTRLREETERRVSVRHVTDYATLERSSAFDTRHPFQLRVGTERFPLDLAAYQLLAQHEMMPVTVYYTPETKTFLSAEVEPFNKLKNEEKQKNAEKRLGEDNLREDYDELPAGEIAQEAPEQRRDTQ